MEIRARNVNDAFVSALWKIKTEGLTLEPSRNGDVYSFQEPVLTCYMHPRERILWMPQRDANPFFHLMECIWMLAGRDDAAWIQQFNSRMSEYAERTGEIHGAYGARWRWVFGLEQLSAAVKLLRKDPTTRRCVVQMWNPVLDLNMDKRDLPCNTTIFFRISSGRLDMTVCNRSNDILWGAYGANAVHFSFLQEVMANTLSIPVGRYYQFSNNFHAYSDTIAKFISPPTSADAFDRYADGAMPLPCILDEGQSLQHFLYECECFCAEAPVVVNDFLKRVATPMREFYLARKQGVDRLDLITAMPDCDWKMAAQDWVARRNKDASE